MFYQSTWYDFKCSQLDKRYCHWNGYHDSIRVKKSVFNDIIYWINNANAEEECFRGQLHIQLNDWSDNNC